MELGTSEIAVLTTGVALIAGGVYGIVPMIVPQRRLAHEVSRVVGPTVLKPHKKPSPAPVVAKPAGKPATSKAPADVDAAMIEELFAEVLTLRETVTELTGRYGQKQPATRPQRHTEAMARHRARRR